MSGLCGWIGGAAPRPDAIGSMAGELNRFDATSIQVAGTSRASVAIAAPEDQAAIFQDGQKLVAVWGRPRFDDPSLAALARERGSARAIARAYDGDESRLLNSLSGSFALAILDAQRRDALLAVDRLGTRALCYEATADALVFGSRLDAVRAYHARAPDIDLQAIYNYVHFHMVPAPLTAYVDHNRLPPGSFLVWRNGKAELREYWRMRFIENEKPDFTALKTRFRALLAESVRDASASGAVGAFLSGGTDSSTIAGMLRDVTGNSPSTYSIGFEAQGYDETNYARIAARHFGTRHHEYYVTPEDVAAAIPRIAAVHDQPYGNASAVPTYYCAKLARADGVSTLLAGDGGDELFGGNDRYAKQHLYSLYSDLPHGLRRNVIEPVVSLMPGRLAGKIHRYLRNACEPMPGRYDNHNLLRHLRPANVFTDDFLSSVSVGQPESLVTQAYGAARAETLINRMLALDLQFTLADNDLPKVTRSCELAQVDVRFPMLNDALVQFAAQLPPAYKLKGTRLRYFFKEALRDYLPPEIIAKKKHGFGLPFGVWLQKDGRLRQIALDSLSDLKKRRIVRSAFIDDLCSVYTRQHAAYYGTMVWILLMLEQWFATRRAEWAPRWQQPAGYAPAPHVGVPALE